MTGIIGIDLGTTSSAVAVYRDGHPTVVTTSEGSRIPSLVTFNRNGEPSVGHRARRQAVVSPADAVYSAKRLLGRQFDDAVVELVRQQQPFTVRRARDGGVEIMTPGSGRPYSPQEVVSMILRQLKQEAESYLGAPVERAVLAVPAHFNDNQRQAAREAGKLAGLKILRIVNEPTAAALAYGSRRDKDHGERRQHGERRRILVIDLGGGHYDVSLLEIDGGSVTVFASHGDPALGCEDWDTTIADYLAGEFLRHHGIELKRNHHAIRRLRSAAAESRQQLSHQTRAMINLPFITSGAAGPRHLNMTLTRTKFASQTAALSARLAQPIHRVLQDAEVSADALDRVLLIGGGTQMPLVREMVRDIVSLAPIDDAHDEQLVALGAALQAGLLAADVHNVALHDVTPLSLGLETMGGLMTTVIPRNTPIPVQRTEIFSTPDDGQTEVEIHVVQGERPMAADNSKLGVFLLQGIPSAPRGVPQIEVTFAVDADGILHVGARDMASGSNHALSVTTREALAASDVKRLVDEAASHEAEDIQKRTLVEAQNLAQQIMYQTKRCLQHLNGVGIKADCSRKRKEITEKLQALQSAIDGRDAEKIRKLTDEIQDASTILNHLVYGEIDQDLDATQAADSGILRVGNYTEIVVEEL